MTAYCLRFLFLVTGEEKQILWEFKEQRALFLKYQEAQKLMN